MFDELYNKKETGYYEYTRPEMRTYVPVGARRMLDVGCGRGGFSSYFKQQRQVEVWGIEMNADAAVHAGRVLDRMFCGEFFSVALNLESQLFDAIVFNDVLEHMLEPEKELKNTIRLLAPGGVVVASIPNFLFWPSLRELLVEQDWRYRDAGILDKTHLRFFTRKSIIRLFADAGYIVDRCEGINIYPGTWRFRWAKRFLRHRLDAFCPAQYAIIARPLPSVLDETFTTGPIQ